MIELIKEIKQWQMDWEAWFADRRLPQPLSLEDFSVKLGEKYVVVKKEDCPPYPDGEYSVKIEPTTLSKNKMDKLKEYMAWKSDNPDAGIKLIFLGKHNI